MNDIYIEIIKGILLGVVLTPVAIFLFLLTVFILGTICCGIMYLGIWIYWTLRDL